MASNDDFSIFYNIQVVFGKYRDTIIVAQLSDGNHGPRLEVIEYMFGLCILGEFGRKEDCCAIRRLDVGAIRYLYGRAC